MRPAVLLLVVLVAACGGESPTTPAAEPSQSTAAVDPATATPEPKIAATLVDDFGIDTWGRQIDAAAGPNGLVAFAHRRDVLLVDLVNEVRIGTIDLAPDRDLGFKTMARQIQAVGFVGGDRIALGSVGGLDIVDLHDTTQRQLLEERADHGRLFVTIDDGVYVAMSSGEVIRFVGRPLEETGRWRLPGWPIRPGSLALAGTTLLASAKGRLFAIDTTTDDGAIQEVAIPGVSGTRTRLQVAVATDILVAVDGDRLVRLARDGFAVLGETTTDDGNGLPNLACDAKRHRCYWRRSRIVEVWRDDLSNPVATDEFNGVVDPATGRAVRSGRKGASLEVTERLGDAWRPLGGRAEVVADVAFSSRANEIFLASGAETFAVSLVDLSVSKLADTSAPIAVGHDGAVLGTGPHGEVVVRDASLTEQRRMTGSGCNIRALLALEDSNTEAAYRKADKLSDRCDAVAAWELEPAHSAPRVAVTTERGALRVLDYRTGRRLGYWADIRGDRDETEWSMAWSRSNNSLDITSGGTAFGVTLGEPGLSQPARGSMTIGRAQGEGETVAWLESNGTLHVFDGASEKTHELGFKASVLFAGPKGSWIAHDHARAVLIDADTVLESHDLAASKERGDVRWTGGAGPILATLLESGGVQLTRMRDGEQLVLTSVQRGKSHALVARWRDRFQVANGVAPPFHLRVGPTDLLGAVAPPGPAGDTGLIVRFLAE